MSNAWEATVDDVQIVLYAHRIVVSIHDQKANDIFNQLDIDKIEARVLAHDNMGDQTGDGLSAVEDNLIELGIIVGPKKFINSNGRLRPKGSNVLDVNLADMAFDQLGIDDPDAHLSGELLIAGIPHYLELFAVGFSESGSQEPDEPTDQFDALCEAFQANGATMLTVRYKDRDYVCFLSPYCS